MRIFYSDRHRLQAGRAELNDGKLVPCFEKPERADIVHRHVMAAGLGPVESPAELGDGVIARVHDAVYLEFLRTVWDRWLAERGDYDALPLNWLAPNMRRRRPDSLDGQLGYHSFDAGTPITAGTWIAARDSALCAINGATLLAQGRERSAFALCRPPGHHAGRDFYGGYCFLNNAAIAAQVLRDAGAARVAVLDVDYHHGNGTQEIFWTRANVLVVNLHADPREEYPYFCGHADETGEGPGEGATLNLPLPIGTDWATYAPALDHALARIRAFGAEAMVVSLGLDTFAHDPISRFLLQTPDYLRMGSAIATAGLPTLFVLEGGYAVDALGANVVGVLTGFGG
ncbi:MAG: hypothetical protein RLY86_2482 [Pseudomonadota bacterium]|jgi:acetoin utilization deacetylase AcuC-like enzyme